MRFDPLLSFRANFFPLTERLKEKVKAMVTDMVVENPTYLLSRCGDGKTGNVRDYEN